MSDDTSESLYEISPQQPPTCPLIDQALKEVDGLQRRIRGYERADEDELRDMLSAVESDLATLTGWNRSGLLEDIRRRTIEIRAWGQEWKDLAKQHAPKPEPATT